MEAAGFGPEKEDGAPGRSIKPVGSKKPKATKRSMNMDLMGTDMEAMNESLGFMREKS